MPAGAVAFYAVDFFYLVTKFCFVTAPYEAELRCTFQSRSHDPSVTKQSFERLRSQGEFTNERGFSAESIIILNAESSVATCYNLI